MVERTKTPYIAGERQMLENWLEFHRETLAWKCDGLTPEQLCERSVPPSTMSLSGLVRHMAEVERGWFRRTLGGESAGLIYASDEPGSDPDGDFNGASPATAVADIAAWQAEIELARVHAAGHSSLDDNGQRRTGEEVSLRWIYVHMIEEYARHNGHADLLRERVDGATGA